MDQMLTVTMTRPELETTRNGLHAFADDFGHDEAEVVARIRSALGELDRALTAAPVAADGPT